MHSLKASVRYNNRVICLVEPQTNWVYLGGCRAGCYYHNELCTICNNKLYVEASNVPWKDTIGGTYRFQEPGSGHRIKVKPICNTCINVLNLFKTIDRIYRVQVIPRIAHMLLRGIEAVLNKKLPLVLVAMTQIGLSEMRHKLMRIYIDLYAAEFISVWN